MQTTATLFVPASSFTLNYNLLTGHGVVNPKTAVFGIFNKSIKPPPPRKWLHAIGAIIAEYPSCVGVSTLKLRVH